MALNQSAVNTEVVNGSANSTVAKALSVVTSTTASFLKGISTLKTLTSTSLATLLTSYVKPKELLASVSNSVTVVRDFNKIITSSIVTSIATITKIASYFITLLVTSTVIATLIRSISIIMPVVDAVAATILTAVNRLITLLAYSSSTVSITKAVDKIVTLVTSTVTATITRLIGFVKTLTVLVTSIVTISEVVIHYITMTIVSSTTAIIEKLQNKLLTISVNCGIILSRLINVTFTTVSTIVSVLLVNTISFTKYPLDRLMYAAQKFRTVSAAKLRKIFY
jgi:hypothetical protein